MAEVEKDEGWSGDGGASNERREEGVGMLVQSKVTVVAGWRSAETGQGRERGKPGRPCCLGVKCGASVGT